MVLDILEDFFAGLIMPPLSSVSSAEEPPPAAYRENRPLQYARIDGDSDSRSRQRVIDAFNRPTSRLFALLMTTRAGGQGLNLASADTVLLFDRSVHYASTPLCLFLSFVLSLLVFIFPVTGTHTWCV
jgi:hypothetical protein